MPFSLESVCCLDFEASALGDRSYPIEAAVVDCATLDCRSWLIRPTPRWRSEGRFAVDAAELHGISMGQLLTDGVAVAQVAAELTERCRRKRVLSDGGEHDQRWLTTLFAGAGKNPPFGVDEFQPFALELARKIKPDGEHILERCEQEASMRFPITHRAAEDARRLAEILRQLARRVD